MKTRKTQLFKPFLGEEKLRAVKETFKSGWIGLGPKTAGFEKNSPNLLA